MLLYVPPRSDLANYENLFDSLSSFNPLMDNSVIIYGDFNCPKYTDNSLVDNRTFSESLELKQLNEMNSGIKLMDLVEFSLSPEQQERNLVFSISSSGCAHSGNNFPRGNYLDMYRYIWKIYWSSVVAQGDTELACE